MVKARIATTSDKGAAVQDRTLQVEYRPIDQLVPYARNARTHSDAHIAQIAASIHEFGWTNPVLVDGANGIIAGHGRVLAARKLGMDTVPVIELAGMTEAQKRAYVLADNKLALNAGWDEEILRLELAELKDIGADLNLLGFSNEELNRVLRGPAWKDPGLTDPDEVPDDPEGAEVFVKAGDLYLLGDHRLLCGDSTNPEGVVRLMDGQKASLLATDPPYLMNYTGGNHPASRYNRPATRDKHWDSYRDPDSSVEFFHKFLELALQHLKPNVAVYQWHATARQALVEQAWHQAGLLWHQTIVWAKARGVLTHSHFMWAHEPCAYGWLEGHPPSKRPPPNEKTVWEVSQKGEQEGIHPTQKPVELFARPIQWHTEPGDICYEPFSGSGTAIIAAERMDRRCFAMEKEPKFVQVAIERWERNTGRKAVKADG